MPLRKKKKSKTEPAVENDGGEEVGTNNLLLADIVLRGTSIFARQFVEKKILKAKYGGESAKKAMKNKSAMTSVTAIAIAKLGTSSMPGALLVSGGLLAKALFDRSEKRRGDKARKSIYKDSYERIP